MAPKALKRPRDPLGPEGPPVRVPHAANRGGGRGPGAPPDPVPGPDPLSERRTTRQREREARVTQEQPPNSSSQRNSRPPSPPPPAARPTVERRQLCRHPAEAPPHPPLVATVEEEKKPKRRCEKLASCMEFIRSFDGTKGTVRGEFIRIDSELICAMFDIPPGMDPLSSVIHHGHVCDWMLIRDDVGKRYLAHQCVYLGWPSVLHAVSMVIMAGHKARCVFAQLLMYLHARFGTGGQKRTTKYNIASFIAGSISKETEWVQDHLTETHPQRFYETFMGIPLTLIFLHCGIITKAECETGFEIPETGWDFPAVGLEDDEDEIVTFLTLIGWSETGRKDRNALILGSGPSDRGPTNPAPQAVDDGVLATLRAEVERITQEKEAMAMELAGLRSRSLWQRQSLLDPNETLVFDIFDLLVHIITNKRDRQMAEAMDYVVYMMEVGERPPSYIVRGNIRQVLETCMGMAHCIIWTSKGRTFTMSDVSESHMKMNLHANHHDHKEMSQPR
ncbi:hypothetical protein R1sor_015972 [Riccia sorocarpa]|uniref:Uncharacterized protein n=1 Tax=Riccia sorocarpa TaxID=122646 RepID=A0ABD3HE26_9MARC